MRAYLLALTILAVSFAGCSEEPAAAAGEDDLFNDFDAPADDGKGLIRGIVIDNSVTPLADAKVTLKASGAETVTNANGAFQFTGLEPGTYFLEVSKTGYSKVQASTPVVANVASPEIVRVQLELIPGAVPAFVPLQYDLFMSCGFKLANYVFDAFYCDPTGAAGLQGQDDSAHVFELDRDDTPSHYQSEIIWEANQPLSQGLVTIQCDRENTACSSGVGSDRICNVRGASPLVCRVNNDIASADVPGGGNNFTTIRDNSGWSPVFAVGLYSNCAGQCVLGAVGIGAAIDQEVKAYISIFYNFKPSEEWMFITDGEHPLPS